MQVWALMIDSFREARDRKLFWVLLAISTLMGLVLACIGYDEDGWTLFFGAVPISAQFDMMPPSLDPARVMAAFVSYVLIDNYIAWLGTAACLIATAGIIPGFLARGAIDVVLSKPMSRLIVLMGKYVGSLSFVAVQATYFVLLTFIILRIQTGQWFWGYLWAAPLLVALFSYLYCVCVLLAIWSRSALTALMLTLLFWVSVAGVTAGNAMLLMAVDDTPSADTPTPEIHGAFVRCLRAARIVLPKTGDIPILVARQMGAATLSDLARTFTGSGGAADSSRESPPAIDAEVESALFGGISWSRSVGSSLIFEAVVLALACWSFYRKDY